MMMLGTAGKSLTVSDESIQDSLDKMFIWKLWYLTPTAQVDAAGIVSFSNKYKNISTRFPTIRGAKAS